MGRAIGFFQTVKKIRANARLHTRRTVRLETSDAEAERIREVVF